MSKIVRLLILVLGVIVFLYLGITLYSVWYEKRILSNWNSIAGNIEQSLKQYPPQKTNQSAMDLELLCAEIDIDIIPRSQEGEMRRLQLDPEKQRDETVRLALKEYVSTQLGRSFSRIDPVPIVLTAYMNRHKDRLQKIVDHLGKSETPVWESDYRQTYYAPLPNLHGHFALQNLLATRALAQIQSEDFAGAEQTLDASWNLNQSLLNRSDFSLMTALTVVEIESGVMRRMPQLSESWKQRLNADLRGKVFTLFDLQVWAITQYFRGNVGTPDYAKSRILHPFFRPYVRIAAAKFVEEFAGAVQEMKDKNLCDYKPQRAAKVRIDGFYHLGDLPEFEPYTFWLRATHAELSNELTAVYLNAAAEPQTSAAKRPSQRCPRNFWIIDGRPSVKLDDPDAGKAPAKATMHLPLQHQR